MSEPSGEQDWRLIDYELPENIYRPTKIIIGVDFGDSSEDDEEQP
jgi:hypothetical protein